MVRPSLRTSTATPGASDSATQENVESNLFDVDSWPGGDVWSRELGAVTCRQRTAIRLFREGPHGARLVSSCCVVMMLNGCVYCSRRAYSGSILAPRPPEIHGGGGTQTCSQDDARVGRSCEVHPAMVSWVANTPIEAFGLCVFALFRLLSRRGGICGVSSAKLPTCP